MSAICLTFALNSQTNVNNKYNIQCSSGYTHIHINEHCKLEIDCLELLPLHDVTSMHPCMFGEIELSCAQSPIIFALKVPVTQSLALCLYLDMLVWTTLIPCLSMAIRSSGTCPIRCLQSDQVV